MSDPRLNPTQTGDRRTWGGQAGDVSNSPVVLAAGGLIIPIRQITNNRFFPHASGTTSTQTGNGTLRAVPFVLPNHLNLSHVGLDVATAGEAGSIVRVGIYDSTNAGDYPGALLIEAGATVDGTSATVQEVACAVTLEGNHIYWLAAAIQNAPTTQPFIRALSTAAAAGPVSTGVPTANTNQIGYQQTGVTGALPATFTSTVTTSGIAPRVHFRLA